MITPPDNRVLFALQARFAAGDAAGLCELGCRSQRGEGVPRDLGVALRCFTAAAAQGHGRAQAELGRCYARGAGVARHLDAAAFWLRAAVAQGEPLAAYELARLVAAGELREETPGEAAHWWRLAATGGFSAPPPRAAAAVFTPAAGVARTLVMADWISGGVSAETVAAAS